MLETMLKRKNAATGVRVTVKTAVAALVIALAAAGNPMPAAERLPYMMVELAVFAAVSGAFSGTIVKNAWAAFPAVLLAQVAGRLAFLAVAAIFQSVSSLSAAVVWSQIQAGLLGMVLQAVAVPAIVIALRAVLLRGEKDAD